MTFVIDTGGNFYRRLDRPVTASDLRAIADADAAEILQAGIGSTRVLARQASGLCVRLFRR